MVMVVNEHAQRTGQTSMYLYLYKYDWAETAGRIVPVPSGYLAIEAALQDHQPWPHKRLFRHLQYRLVLWYLQPIPETLRIQLTTRVMYRRRTLGDMEYEPLPSTVVYHH